MDVNKLYLKRGRFCVGILGRDLAWLDSGTERSLLEAANFVPAVERCQGIRLVCIEEIAWWQDWIDTEDLAQLATLYQKSSYGGYPHCLAEKDRLL